MDNGFRMSQKMTRAKSVTFFDAGREMSIDKHPVCFYTDSERMFMAGGVIMGESISRILIQTVVKRALNDIKETPERTLRNLVDMAQQLTGGRFQQKFFQAAQKMLKNENSAYFSLMKDTVEHTEEDRLLTFGMNLGYNSCTVGAGIIRELEAERGHNIPWAVTLQLAPGLTSSHIRQYSGVIEQGETMGIYTWLLFAHGSVEASMSLMDEHPNCAFTLFCRGEDLCGRVLDEMRERKNLMLALPFDDEAETICVHLREAGLLYSLYHVYGENDLPLIESGDLFFDMARLHPVFSALIPEEGCSNGIKDRVYDVLCRTRLEQTYRTILWELYRDGLMVDKIISDDGCWVSFSAYGEFYGIGDDGVKRCYGSMDTPLADLFRQAFPKSKGLPSVSSG